MENEKRYQHPSYGMIQFSRRTGNPKLFGSLLDNHASYVTLSIKHATLIRSDSGDRYYGPMRGDVVEVNLSAAQFAEVLTTMNVGLGVPCTIAYVDNKKIEDPPTVPSESESLRTEFRERMQEFVKKTTEGIGTIRETLQKPTLNKKDRADVLRFIERITQELGQNMPFFLELYQESTEQVMTAAKTEIDAFSTSVIQQLGKAALLAKNEEEPQALPEKTES